MGLGFAGVLAVAVAVPVFTFMGYLLGLVIGTFAAQIQDWSNKPSSQETLKTEQIPSGILRMIAYNYLPASKDLRHLHQTNRFFKESLQSDLDKRQFLEAVAHGNQDEAERLLKKNLRLMTGKYSLKDYSKRKFPLISGFQYALAALDTRYMIGMMLKCIKEDETLTIEEKKELVQALLEQYTELEQKGVTYVYEGITYLNQMDFGFTPLITVLQEFVDNFDQRTWTERGEYFKSQVGTAQFLVPAHLAQHYCDPEVPFDPKPTFTAESFKRCLEVRKDGKVHSWWGGVEFILGKHVGYLEMGCGYIRRQFVEPVFGGNNFIDLVRQVTGRVTEIAAVKTLFEIRKEDRLRIKPALNALIKEFDQELESQEQFSVRSK